MADHPIPAPQPTHRGTAFRDMKPRQKFFWIVKVTICALSFGMLFPGVMEE
jgi:hypothetical protein